MSIIATTQEERLEVYSDMFSVRMSPYTVIFNFAMREPPPVGRTQVEGATEPREPNPQTVAIVRMSPEHAKVMAIILRRHIQDYERQTGVTIDVPQRVLQELNIPPEDWRQFGG